MEKGIWSNHVTYLKETVVMKPRTMLREYKLTKISIKQKVSIALANSLDILSIPLKYVSISGHFLESLLGAYNHFLRDLYQSSGPIITVCHPHCLHRTANEIGKFYLSLPPWLPSLFDLCSSDLTASSSDGTSFFLVCWELFIHIYLFIYVSLCIQRSACVYACTPEEGSRSHYR